MTVPKTVTKKNELKSSERLARYHFQSSLIQNVSAFLRMF